MTLLETRQPNFPENPSDGFQIKEDLPDGGYVIWTYSEQFNQWTYEVFTAAIEGFLYTRQVLTTPFEVINASGGKELVETQEQVNNTIATATEAVVRAGGRTTDQVDFLQNSIGKGSWNHAFTGVGYPREGEFWTDANTTQFKDITRITLNDTAISGAEVGNNSGTLQDPRVGDYLVIQERGTNDFGMYVVVDLGVQIIQEQTIRTFGLTLHSNRASGATVVNSSRCQITTSRPTYVIVQDEEPKVAYRGALGYRESDDVLSISNWATGFAGGIGPQWTEINRGGGGGEGGDYLSLSGGEVDGKTVFKRTNSPEINSYVLSVESPFLGENGTKNTAFRVTAEGVVKAGHDTSNPFMATASNDVVTKGFADAEFLAKTAKSDLSMNGHKITGLAHPTADAQAVNRGYADGRYLQLAAGGQVTGYVQFQDDTKLQMGGTYNNNIIAGSEGFTDNSIVATLGFVNHQIAESVGGLSVREKMYLKGFYPYRLSQNSPPQEGEITCKDTNYLLSQDPDNWKHLEYTVVDAYGEDLAGTFMNHMDNQQIDFSGRVGQVWFARENGRKFISWHGVITLKDNNFENRMSMTLESGKKEVGSKNYDLESKRVDYGDVLWIKHSMWA